jgi:ubiquinone/menaquinone biosynthesis C-methylase UbiE
VISNSTFEHIRQDKKALSEVARVIKKGGLFFITIPDPNLNQFLKRKLKNATKVEMVNQRIAHSHYRSLDQWQKIMVKNGLRVVSHKKYFSPKATQAWLNLFSMAVFKPYKRELWSYLKDSPYGKLMPKKIIIWLLNIYLLPLMKNIYHQQGSWILIIAQKE